MKSFYCFWAVALFVAGTVPESNAACEDYSPCNCGEDALGNLYVNCIEVLPIVIQAAFSNTTALDIYSLVLILPAAGGNIPADLLSGKRALIIDLLGPNSDSFQLVMDPGALRSSSSYTKQLVISKCNLVQLDFSFLRGFSRLEELRLDYATNIKPIENLPPLSSLSGLAIANSRGFEALVDFPAIAFSRLNRLYLYNDDLNDQSLTIILNAFASATSANTLQVVTLGNNRITRVPQQILSFPSLLDVAFTNNNISLVTTGAFSLSAPGIEKVYLNNNSLNTIEPGSFQGDFSRAQIQLSFNNLTAFDAAVFQTVLTQMSDVGNNGTIYLESNPFECDCGLAWLIRDNPNLLKATNGAACANTTRFEELDPNGFSQC